MAYCVRTHGAVAICVPVKQVASECPECLVRPDAKDANFFFPDDILPGSPKTSSVYFKNHGTIDTETHLLYQDSIPLPPHLPNVNVLHTYATHPV